jgi:aminoglycoside phosphotransferase (APT) family kinase protein
MSDEQLGGTARGAPAPPETLDMQRSSRDLEQLRVDLRRWLEGRLPTGASPAVPELSATSANGMSSETLLFEATWSDAGSTRWERLVARAAPDPGDIPVFASYDMRRQYDVIRLVGELTDVPVPKVWWYEADASVLGAPFFVMARIDGLIPPDVMPYNFGDSWLYDATPQQQRRLQDATVDVLARLHAIDDVEARFGFLAFDEPGDSALARHVAHTEAWYRFALGDGLRSPLVERGFAWLHEHWPADEGDTVVSWGDSRIGNAIYDDFSPVAILDWEMAGLGPRQLDVAWLVFGHMVFEDIARVFDLPGMPGFLRPDDVVARYETTAGVALRDLRWFLVYAAVQWGIVFLRTSARQLHFGEIEPPDRVDDLLRHSAVFERLIAG